MDYNNQNPYEQNGSTNPYDQNNSTSPYSQNSGTDPYAQNTGTQGQNAYGQGGTQGQEIYGQSGTWQNQGTYGQQNPYQQNIYGQNGYQQSQYQNYQNYQYGDMEEPMSVKEWLIVDLLMMIPCVNLVLVFVWAFSGSEKKSKSNFFKANLIFAGCFLAFYIVLLIIAFAAGFASVFY